MPKRRRNVDPAVATARGKVGQAAYQGDLEAEEHARAELAEAMLAQHIKKTVAGWPPLREEQVRRLVDLFAPVDPSTSDGPGAAA